MRNFCALLRAVNVGGKNKLKMIDLKIELNRSGLQETQTYIQSGNIVFKSEQYSTNQAQSLITDVLAKSFDIQTTVMVIEQEQLAAIAEQNPFGGRNDNEAKTHLFFLAAPAQSNAIDALSALQSNGEEFVLSEHCLYLWAPEGIGRSKLAAKAEKTLAVSTTARNWRTTQKLLQMMA